MVPSMAKLGIECWYPHPSGLPTQLPCASILQPLIAMQSNRPPLGMAAHSMGMPEQQVLGVVQEQVAPSGPNRDDVQAASVVRS